LSSASLIATISGTTERTNAGRSARFSRDVAFGSSQPFSTIDVEARMAPALAHVKWFADFDWTSAPSTMAEITTPTFWTMLALSVVVLAALVALDKRIDAITGAQRLRHWFETKSGFSLLVMRVGAFATLLVAWQQGTLFAPELEVHNLWIERLQLAIIVLLFWERTTTLSGLGLLAIWFYGAARFGIFHMLDYMNVLGVAYFLTVRPLSNKTLQASALPALYASLGVSLMWLGCEKLVYPQWINYLLEQNPVLTLGLDRDFFRVAAAFIELGLGFMLILGLFGRSLSITITLTFFLTTMVFGKLEIIGHTLVHAALIVFLFEGPGHSFRPPAYFHRGVPLRMAFATVNFVLAVGVMLLAYTANAQRAAAAAASSNPLAGADSTTCGAVNGHEMDHPPFEVPAGEAAPTLAMEIVPDVVGGWNLRFAVTDFRFAPEHAGGEHAMGEGHIHLHVDGRKEARVYSEWFHLPALPPGEHQISATLNTNDHREYRRDGKPIGAEANVTAKP
jgi:hypothetical protein